MKDIKKIKQLLANSGRRIKITSYHYIDNMYFHFHTEDVHFNGKLECERCTYIKPNDERCKNKITIGLPFCRVHEKIVQHIKIGQSTIPHAGLGLFAYNGTDNTDIVFKKGTVVCKYYGEIIDEQQLRKRYGKNTAPYGIEIKPHQIYEDGALRRGLGTLINHYPKKQNCRFSIAKNNTINLVATKNIRNGAELFVSYGKSYKMQETNVYTDTNKRKYR